MDTNRNRTGAAVLLWGLLTACGAGTPLSSDRGNGVPGGADEGGAPPQACTAASQCPTGYTCDDGLCRPPEEEASPAPSQRPPVASPNYVYAMNPGAASVAKLDPRTLAVEAIAVGGVPVDIIALADVDAAVVLTTGESLLSFIDASQSPSRVQRVPLRRPYGRLAVSPDGAFAVAYPDPALPPGGGDEGVVTVVDLAAARAGAPLEQVRYERAAGYRVTDVVFQLQGGVTQRVHVFAKSTLSTIDLVSPAAAPLPARLELPASMSADVASREVIADADGATILLRSTTAPELVAFDGATLRTVPLPEVATDVDLFADGQAAVAVLRTAKRLAYIEIPADLLAPAGITQIDMGGLAVGQVELSPPGAPSRFALAYTNASEEEAFARVDLPGGAVTARPLEKRVERIAVAPDGRSALIVHRAAPTSSATDPYERQVDLDEGYSVADLQTGYVQLKRTGKVRPGPFAFAPSGEFAGIAFADSARGRFSLESVDLRSLVSSSLSLASEPRFVGPVPAGQGASPHRVFVSQVHPAGRLSVVQLDDGQVRTATGFTLNAEIE